MQISAHQLSQLLNGVVIGDPNVTVSKPGKIEESEPGMICFLGNPKYERYAYDTKASILIVPKTFEPQRLVPATLIQVEDVYSALALLMEKFGSPTEGKAPNISKLASIHPTAKLGANVSIGDFVVIEENVQIGDNTTIAHQAMIAANTQIGSHTAIFAGVKIHKDSIIGNHCTLNANCVIGSEGFGYAPQLDGSYKKIQHIGNVILEDYVDVGANSTIDRSSLGSTILRRGVKIDNLVQIAHNVEIGENTVIAALAAVAGSTKVGKNCRVGGMVGITGHLQIADGTQIQAQSGVNHSTQPNEKLFGTPAFGYMNYLRSYGVFKTLPDLVRRVTYLEKLLPKKE